MGLRNIHQTSIAWILDDNITFPVAETRPCIPPCEIGLPVTHAEASISEYPKIEQVSKVKGCYYLVQGTF